MKLTANFKEAGDVVEGIGKQLPFAIARTLTKVAQDGQAAGIVEVGQVFTQRNDWTRRGIKIKPATKTNLVAEVFTDTSNRKSGAPDYLLKQEDGGDRVPVNGRHYIAIPTKYLRRIAPGVIGNSLRPRSLLPQNAVMGQEYSGRFGFVGKSATPFPRTQAQSASLGQRDFVAFVQKAKSGTLCIFVRHAGMRYRGSGEAAEPWYTLVTHAQIKKRFHLEGDVQKAVDANLQRRWDETLQEIAPLKI